MTTYDGTIREGLEQPYLSDMERQSRNCLRGGGGVRSMQPAGM